MSSRKRTSRASSRQPDERTQNPAQSTSRTSNMIGNTDTNPAVAASATTAAATTTRRSRSRSNTPAPVVSTSTTALATISAVPALSSISEVPALPTISEAVSQGAAQPNEAGPSTTNPNTNNTSSKSRAKPTHPVNPLDAPPSFATLQGRQVQEATNDTNAVNQTTGPFLALSQPPPAFSQLSSSFGSAPLGSALGLGAFGGAPFGANTSFGGASFGGAPLNANTSFGSARGGGGLGGASFISTLSSPTASGNFRDTSIVLPDTNTRNLPSTTHNTTALPTITAPRDTRAQVISDDEGDEDEFSKELRATTSRPAQPTGPLLTTSTSTPHIPIPARPSALMGGLMGGGGADEEEEEDAHFNALYASRPRKIVRAADRPGPVAFDKEDAFFNDVHGEDGEGGGSNAGTRTISNRNRPPPLEPRALPPRPQGGRSQRIVRSGATVADLMGSQGVDTSVTYGAATAVDTAAAPAETSRAGESSRAGGIRHGPAVAESSRGPGRHGAGPVAAATPVAADNSRGPAGPGETSRGRDAGGVGPHRNQRRKASPVGMSSHPYAFTGLTPSTNSSGKTNAEANPNPNPNVGDNTNTNANAHALALATTTTAGVNVIGFGIGLANTSLEEIADPSVSFSASAGPATQVWRRGLGVLRDIDDDNDDDDVPSRANRSPGRTNRSPRRAIAHHATTDAADVVTDDDEESKRMAEERRKNKWQREADARRALRRGGSGLAPTTPIKLGRHGSSDDDNDRTPTQASQQIAAFAVAPAPVASTSGALAVGGVVPKVAGRPGLWKLATANGAGPSGTQGSNTGGSQPVPGNETGNLNAEDRPAHARTDTVASSSNHTVISRLDSAVSQLPALPGIPGSFDGMSGIGGQNELGNSQVEESLPAFRYNSRGTGPALSTIHDADDDTVPVGVSFNPYVDLESQMPSRPHSDIIYNSSGNPIARSSGELLRSESSDILEPVIQPLRDEVFVTAAQRPIASGSRASQSTSSSQGRKRRFGSYDPADDLVSWDNSGEPNRDRTGETTGPQLFNPEAEELQRRTKNLLHHDDDAGNLAFGRSRQTLLDGIVRPISEIRAASTSASPTRDAVPQGQTTLTTPAAINTSTTGPSIGDEPANPVIIDDDDDYVSPTESQRRRASRHYVRNVVMPDRDRRRRGVQSDDEEMRGVPPPQLPTFPLTYVASEESEGEVVEVEAEVEVEDDTPPQPQPNGTVLVPNSSGSAVADDNDAEDLDPENAEEPEVIGEWHEDQGDEVSLEDKMEGLFPPHAFIPEPPIDTTPLGSMLAKPMSTQPSMSSFGDELDAPEGSFSALYPPNQEAYMRMHAKDKDASDVETEPSVYPSQPVRHFDTNFTPFSEEDVLGDAADNNPPPGNLSRYPDADNLSISTDNSVLRSQLYSSKLMAYNSEQAGLKPGDEGYTEPPEVNYAKWAQNQGFSDAASTEAGASVPPAKGKATGGNPFAALLVRMPGSNGGHESEEGTSRPSRDSPVIPDSQGEPPLLASQPPVRLNPASTSTKSTDPRRRPAPQPIDSGIHAYSQAGPSRSQTQDSAQPSQATKNRTAWQSTSSKPYVSSPKLSMRSATPPEVFNVRHSSATLAPLVASLPLAGAGSSSTRSDAEAQIEAELIPETQFSQPVSHTSSLSVGTYSPIIRYERQLEELSEQLRHSSTRKPTVLVPGTASPSQASNIISREPSVMATQLSLVREHEGDTDDEGEGLVPLSAAPPQEDSFGLSGIGGQNDFALDTQHDALETQCESAGTTMAAPTIPSFELPDPASVSALPQQPASSKRKRLEEDPELDEIADKPSPPKKSRKVPVAPAPLPAEPIRRTRSFTIRSNTAPVSRGPLRTPVPPPRLTDAGRSRKVTVVPRTPSPKPQRTSTLYSIIESSSPLSPLPPGSPRAHKNTVSPIRRSKTYMKGRTLVPDSSASQVDDDEGPGTSGERAGTSGTQATQDPFKSLAKSASKPKTGKRTADAVLGDPSATTKSTATPKRGKQKASAAFVDPFSTAMSSGSPQQPTRKRARDESPEDCIPPTADLSPPPSKKHRREAPTSAVVPIKTGSKAKKSPVAPKQPKPTAPFVSTPQRSCQRGGRVFALWGKFYYTATVKDSWEDEKDESEITCQIQFDDKTWTETSLSELYRCELREGDKIVVPGVKGKPLAREGYVSAVPLWEERSRVSVRLQSIPKEEVGIFEGKKIGVAAEHVQKEWRDRRATNLEDIGLGKELIRVQEEKERKEAEAKAIGRTIPSAAFLGPPRWKDSPPPPPRISSLPSRGQKRPPQAIDEEAPSTSSKRRRLEAPPTGASSSKPFANHLIMLALAINDDKGNRLEKAQRTAHKDELIASIERLGGKVVNGFEELLQWDGKTSDNGDRWVWKAGAIAYTEESSAPIGASKRGKRATPSEPPKLFLVADGPNRTVKYLMALAAGIPCVDQGWVRDENVAPWHAYLLPAGQSPSLGHTCSQWVDHSYSAHPRNLKALLDEPGPIHKPFDEKDILFVYPSMSEDEIEEEQIAHIYPYTALACLMGASRVEIVCDLAAASRTLEQYDVIIHEDESLPSSLLKFSKSKKGSRVICSDINWVRDCLITGTFLRHCKPQ